MVPAKKLHCLPFREVNLKLWDLGLKNYLTMRFGPVVLKPKFI